MFVYTLRYVITEEKLKSVSCTFIKDVLSLIYSVDLHRDSTETILRIDLQIVHNGSGVLIGCVVADTRDIMELLGLIIDTT